jgi:hypothetical protein
VAAVECFSLLTMIDYVAYKHPTGVAGAGALVLSFGNFGVRTPYNIGVHNLP